MITLTEYRELIARAKEVGYKNLIPKFKENNQLNPNSMRGFEKRLDNWEKGLTKLEDKL